MELIDEIQNGAVDSNTNLGTLLRKCKVLAAGLNSQPLENWLIWESNGYPQNTDVPDYRIWELQLKGHFSGGFGSGMKNAPIPHSCLPDKVKTRFENYECRQSIETIEQLLKKDSDGILRITTGDLAPLLGMKVYQGLNCLQAWGEFGTGALVEVLNAVRNRILDFILALKKESPDIGRNPPPQEREITPSKVTQIFNTTVYGAPANIVGSASNSNITFQVTPYDFNSLAYVLKEHSVSSDLLAELKEAIQSDPKPNKKNNFGPKVSAWISKMMLKACEGAWTISISAAGQLLGAAISQYYNI